MAKAKILEQSFKFFILMRVGFIQQNCQRNARAGFFLTSVTKKTKTQAQNSRKKLNLREAVSSGQEKLKEKTQF